VLLGTPLGNILGIGGNIEGTNEKNPPPTQNLKEKKSRHLECMLQPTHWLHVCLVSKTIGHHFWPRLMAGAEIEQGISPAPSQNEKTRAHHECMLSLPIGCMKFLFPKLFVTIFGLANGRVIDLGT